MALKVLTGLDPFTASLAGKASKSDLFIDAMAFPYNCVADNLTNNAVGLNDAQTAAAAADLPMFLGPGIFVTNTLVEYKAPIIGPNAEATTIKAGASFVGSCVIDFDNSPEFKHIAKVTIDMNHVAGVQAFGSSGDASGSANSLFESVKFHNGTPDTYAVGGASTTNIGGMLTGATFLRCRWENVPLWANVGANQDDVIFIGCRFHMTPSYTGPTDAPLVLGGQNNSLLSTFMYLVASTASGADKPVIKIGSSPVKVSGLFLECEAGANYTHLFYATNPNYMLEADTIQYGLADNTGFVALVRANLHEGTLPRSVVQLRNCAIKTGSAVPYVFDVLSEATTASKSAYLNFSGVDGVTDLLSFASGSVSSSAKVHLTGTKDGTNYRHSASIHRPGFLKASA